MVLGDNFAEIATRVAEEREVLNDVEQAPFSAGTTNHRLQRDNTLLILALDLLPIGEVLPVRR